MSTITANDLKVKGISSIKNAIEQDEEVIITHRGKEAYVVIPIEKYNTYREYELECALHESRADYESGNYVSESAAEHLKRLANEI